MNPQAWLDTTMCVHLVVTLAHFLWQGTAILVLAIVAGWALRHASASARYGVYVATLVLMALCPPATFVWSGSVDPVVAPSQPTRTMVLTPAPVEATPRPIVADAPTTLEPHVARPPAPPALLSSTPAVEPAPAPEQAVPSPRFDWRGYAPYAVFAYLLGAVLMFIRLLLGVYGGQRLRRRSVPVDDEIILAAFARQARALGLRFTPALRYCTSVCVPTVIGVLRPMILLPLSVTSGLTPEQIEVILAHELAHVRRYDHLVNFAQRVIEALFFFHPAVWLVSRRIRIEREHCCDDRVLAAGGGALAYAASLVRMAELSCSRGPARLAAVAALGADGQPSQLRIRILRLIAGPAPQRVRLRRTWAFAIPVLLVAAVTLSCLVPSRHGDQSRESATTQPDAPDANSRRSSESAPASEPKENIVSRVYDVQDLLAKVYDFRTHPGNGPPSEQDKKQATRDLEDLVVKLVDPGTWQEEGKNDSTKVGSIEIWNDRLIVRHTESVHRQVVELFKDLRESKDISNPREARPQPAPAATQPVPQRKVQLPPSSSRDGLTADPPLKYATVEEVARQLTQNFRDRATTRAAPGYIVPPEDVRVTIIPDPASSQPASQRSGVRTLRGRVVDEQGQPVAAARVRMLGHPSAESEAVTAQDGAFELHHYLDELRGVTLLASSEDGQRQGLRDFRFDPLELVPNKHTEIVAKPARRVTVQVVNGAGEAVAGVNVRIVHNDTSVYTRTTDAEGVARFQVAADLKSQSFVALLSSIDCLENYSALPFPHSQDMSPLPEKIRLTIGRVRWERRVIDGRTGQYSWLQAYEFRVDEPDVVAGPNLAESQPAPVNISATQPAGATSRASDNATGSEQSAASLTIRFDIPGAEEEGEFHLSLMPRGLPLKPIKLPNGHAMTASEIPPGEYDFFRMKLVRVGDRGQGVICDRRRITLQAGKTVTVEVVRKSGQPLEGEAVGEHEGNTPGVFITVRPAAVAELSWQEAMMATIDHPPLDGVASLPDGTWSTSIIPPGDYVVMAEAYKPESAESRSFTGIRVPNYTGIAKVTVPKEGKPPRIRIHMLAGTAQLAETQPAAAVPTASQPAQTTTVREPRLHYFSQVAKFGYVDDGGQVIIPPKFDRGQPFSEGLADVKIISAGSPKWGYINTNGAFVIQPQFERTEQFSEGLGCVRVDGKYGYITAKGDWAIRPQFDGAWPFSEGLGVVKKDGHWIYVDKTGNVVITTQSDVAYRWCSFSEGLALTKFGNKWGYLDKKGHMAIEPQFEVGNPEFENGMAFMAFKEGLAAVQKGGKWGYIDHKGHMVLPATFDEARQFHEGYAVVRRGGKVFERFGEGPHKGKPAGYIGGFGLIDRSGRFVLEPTFKKLNGPSEGLIAFADYVFKGKLGDLKYGYLDLKGDVVIPLQFEGAMGFVRDVAMVMKKDPQGMYVDDHIDRTGRSIFERQGATASQPTTRSASGNESAPAAHFGSGRIEGTLRIGPRIAANETVVLWVEGDTGHGGCPAKTDENGKFTFDAVPSGPVRVCRHVFVQGVPGRWWHTQSTPWVVEPGKITRVELGGKGRPVTGRLISRNQTPRQIDWEGLSALAHGSGCKYMGALRSDGTFRIEDVPAGSYELIIWSTEEQLIHPLDVPLGKVTQKFTVPEMPGDRSDEPLDLGDVTFSETWPAAPPPQVNEEPETGGHQENKSGKQPSPQATSRRSSDSAPAGEPKAKTISRVYDVQDLLAKVHDFKKQRGKDAPSEEDQKQAVHDLQHLLMKLIEPGIWQEEDKADSKKVGSMQIWDDRLIVRHTESVHRQLVELFRKLRESTVTSHPGETPSGNGAATRPAKEQSEATDRATGRTAVGRLATEPRSGLVIAPSTIRMRMAFLGPPNEMPLRGAKGLAATMKMYFSEEHQESAISQDSSRFRSDVSIREDGGFEAKDLPPGKYLILVQVFDRPGAVHVARELIGSLTMFVDIPEPPAAGTHQPVDLGTLVVKPPTDQPEKAQAIRYYDVKGSADEIASKLQKTMDAMGAGDNETIKSFPSMNQIIVTAPPSTHKTIERFLERLDGAPRNSTTTHPAGTTSQASENATGTEQSTASLTIRFDIPLAEEEAEFQFNQRGASPYRIVMIRNGGEVTLRNLSPGSYDFFRMKRAHLWGKPCDRQTLTLNAGQTTTVNLVRKEGQPIEGGVVGDLAGKVKGSMIQVRERIGLRLIEFVGCEPDGSWKTSLIPPGEYLLEAEAYAPEPPDAGFVSGWPVPAYTGTARVTVPKEGKPPRVRIRMRATTTEPANTQPAPTSSKKSVEDQTRMADPRLVPRASEIPNNPRLSQLTIRFDIPGAEEEGEFQFKGDTRDYQSIKVRNGGTVTVQNLSPGSYDFFRVKSVPDRTRGLDRSWGGLCDRRRLVLKAGQTTRVDVVRTEGQAIEGALVGFDARKIEVTIIDVRPVAVAGLSIRQLHDLTYEFPTLDVIAAETDGSWKTSMIPPGEYLLTAAAHEGGPESQFMSGEVILPSYAGVAVVTVPREGKPPRVLIHMKENRAPERELDWGKPAGGLQIRLDEGKSRLYRDGSVQFIVDARNIGTQAATLTFRSDLIEVEVDGTPYHLAGVSAAIPQAYALQPGEQKEGIPFLFASKRTEWADEHGKPLDLTSEPHVFGIKAKFGSQGQELSSQRLFLWPSDMAATRPTTPRADLAPVPPPRIPSGLIGTWLFDNPVGDNEQMAIFDDGRVLSQKQRTKGPSREFHMITPDRD